MKYAQLNALDKAIIDTVFAEISFADAPWQGSFAGYEVTKSKAKMLVTQYKDSHLVPDIENHRSRYDSESSFKWKVNLRLLNPTLWLG